MAQLRPNLVGPVILYSEATRKTDFADADLAAIDYTYNTTPYPHARSATVDSYFDERSFNWTGKTLKDGMANSFGLFLSDDYSKGNVIIRCYGKVVSKFADAQILGKFFFGRGESNTVVSSLIAASNQMHNWIVLPSTQNVYSTIQYFECNVDIWANLVPDGKNYVFGFEIANCSGADRTSVIDCSLSMNKFSEQIPVYTSDRM